MFLRCEHVSGCIFCATAICHWVVSSNQVFSASDIPEGQLCFCHIVPTSKVWFVLLITKKISSVRFLQFGTSYYIFTRGHWIFIAFFDHWISQRRNFECKQERTKWLSNLVKFLAKNRTNFLFFQIGANYACFASSWTAKHLFFKGNQQCCTSLRDLIKETLPRYIKQRKSPATRRNRTHIL